MYLITYICILYVLDAKFILVYKLWTKEISCEDKKIFKNFSFLNRLYDYSQNKAKALMFSPRQAKILIQWELMNNIYVSAFCSFFPLFLGGWEAISIFKKESVLNIKLYST